MAVDINKLTLGEVAKVEELSGLSISSIGDDDKPKGLALAALAFVAKRREDPKFSWNDALLLTFDEAGALLGINADDAEADAEGEAEDPTSPGSSPTVVALNRASRRSK